MTDVLAAVDATDAAEPVLRTAALVAQALGRPVRAVHAEPLPAAVQDQAEALGVELQMLSGPADQAVVEAATDPAVDLVVVGLHGTSEPPAPGRTVRALAGRLNVPLVVVPASAPARRVPERILFALDGTRTVSAAARPVIASYVAAGIDVVALHVYRPDTVPQFHDGPEDEEVWRDEFLAAHVADLDVRLTTRPGPLVPALLQAAVAQEVDLIALPVWPDASLAEGSVLHQVLMGAGRPVVLVPLNRIPGEEVSVADRGQAHSG